MGRFRTAWRAFWMIWRRADCAKAWDTFVATQSAPEEKPDLSPDAIYTLAVLQRGGRLVDFLREDISGYDDAQVGAAVRQIHAGCRKVLEKHFTLEPVMDEAEGARVTVEEGFDSSRIALSGSISGQPPFQGTLRHRGWRVTQVNFPERTAARDATVVCPAEVDV